MPRRQTLRFSKQSKIPRDKTTEFCPKTWDPYSRDKIGRGPRKIFGSVPFLAREQEGPFEIFPKASTFSSHRGKISDRRSNYQNALFPVLGEIYDFRHELFLLPVRFTDEELSRGGSPMATLLPLAQPMSPGRPSEARPA